MKAHEVTEFDDDLVQLVERMQLLMDDAQGVGLAATQVGCPPRLFVFERATRTRTARTPSSTRGSSSRPTEQETDEEGCLSLQGVRVPVERSTHVIARGQGSRPARTCATSSTVSPRASSSTSSTTSTAC